MPLRKELKNDKELNCFNADLKQIKKQIKKDCWNKQVLGGNQEFLGIDILNTEVVYETAKFSLTYSSGWFREISVDYRIYFLSFEKRDWLDKIRLRGNWLDLVKPNYWLKEEKISFVDYSEDSTILSFSE